MSRSPARIDPISTPRLAGLSARITRSIAPLRLFVQRLKDRRTWTSTTRRFDGDGPALAPAINAQAQEAEGGVGPLNHRRYRIRIAESVLSAEELLERFRQDPNHFAPTSFARFEPDPRPRGLSDGERYTVVLPGPWNGPVVAITGTPSTITLETQDGHLEAGRIEFRTHTDNDLVVFTIESFARSGDRIFDALYHHLVLPRLMQSEMWVQVLESAAEASGGRQLGRIELETTIYKGADR